MASPDKEPIQFLLDLGAVDISIRAIEFNPKLGARPTGKEVPVRWSVTVTPPDHGKPAVRALRDNAVEALVACAERAALVYKGAKGAVDPVDTGEVEKPKKPKPAPKPPVDDDDDLDDLI